jgi:tripartite-type tricarboxylate transporter receptor subunit TctC
MSRPSCAVGPMALTPLRAGLMAALALAACGGEPIAEDYPSQPIRLVIPFAAGGTTDLTGRVLAAELGEQLGQQVVVENIDGAGGTVASDQVARARPDGYTLILHVASTSAINPFLYPDLTYDMREDFTPLALMTRVPNIVVVRKDFPANTIQEFVALAKENPGLYNYGSSGNGTILHLSGALFAKQAGIDIVHIPYPGAGPAMNDLIAGTIDALFDNFPTGLVQGEAGNVKALAITTTERSPAMPDLPTVAESGYPEYDTYSWSAIYAPPGLPDDILARLSAAAIATANDPETAQRLQDLGAEVIGSTPAELAEFRDRMLDYWGPIVAASGAVVE